MFQMRHQSYFGTPFNHTLRGQNGHSAIVKMDFMDYEMLSF